MMFGHSKRTRRRHGGLGGMGGDRGRGLKRPIVMITSVASFCAFTVGTVFGRRLRTRNNNSNNNNQRDAVPGCYYPATEDAGATVCATPHATDALDCAVCLEELVLPRVAPCGHTFCTPCISGIIRTADHNVNNINIHAPKCPTCRRRISVDTVQALPVNFAARAIVEARARNTGEDELRRFYTAENNARRHACADDNNNIINSSNNGDDDEGYESEETVALLVRTWNWFKWTAIIATELGAFLVSLKEVLDTSPSRHRRFQALV